MGRGIVVKETLLSAPRLAALGRALGRSRMEALGCLVYLWRRSRAAKQMAHPEEDLAAWLEEIYPRRSAVLRAALETTGFLRPGAPGTIVVVDDEDHHLEAEARARAGRASGRARAGARAPTPAPRARARARKPAPAAPPPPPAPPAPPPLQLEMVPAEGKRTPSQRAWACYAAAYKLRHGQDPTRSARVNAQLGQFVACVGEEDAGAILEFYVRHPSRNYQVRLHPISMALMDAEGLRTQYLNRKSVTQETARHDERFESARTQWEQIESGEL